MENALGVALAAVVVLGVPIAFLILVVLDAAYGPDYSGRVSDEEEEAVALASHIMGDWD